MELISKLVSSKRLNLLYTLDGSEYVTEAQLGLEIQDEVGRTRHNVVGLLKANFFSGFGSWRSY